MRQKTTPEQGTARPAVRRALRHPLLWIGGLAAVNAVLLAGIAACIHMVSQSNQRIGELEDAVSAASAAVMANKTQAELSPKIESVQEPLPEEPLFTREMVKEFAAGSKDKFEFFQRFFDDTFVYNWEGETIFVPVDDSLPKNSYDWDNLVLLDKDYKEYEYQEYGVTRTVKGIDVSKYQGYINWDRVAADGVEYAFLRVGYRGYGTGAVLEDEYFHRNAKAANQAGVAVGAYFFSQAINEEEAREEARIAVKALEGYDVTYPVAIDMEDVAADARTAELTQEEFTDIAIAFCETIKEAGYTPMIYCNSRWFTMKLDLSRLTEYDKWFAQYYNRPFFPYEFQVWQYSSTGEVDGIEGDVDLNISFVRYGDDFANPDKTE